MSNSPSSSPITSKQGYDRADDPPSWPRFNLYLAIVAQFILAIALTLLTITGLSYYFFLPLVPQSARPAKDSTGWSDLQGYLSLCGIFATLNGLICIESVRAFGLSVTGEAFKDEYRGPPTIRRQIVFTLLNVVQLYLWFAASGAVGHILKDYENKTYEGLRLATEWRWWVGLVFQVVYSITFVVPLFMTLVPAAGAVIQKPPQRLAEASDGKDIAKHVQ